MADESRVKTTRRKLARRGELTWGGDGQPWTDAIETNEGVTVSENVLQPDTGVAIPDREDLHARYDATELSLNDGDSVTTWGDETGNGHDLSDDNSAPQYATDALNGNPVVRHDGVADFLAVAWSALSQPNQIFAVIQNQSIKSSVGGDVYVIDGEGTFHGLCYDNDNANGWQIYAGGTPVNSGSVDTNAHIITGLFDGSSSALRLDGDEIASGDVGANGLDGLTTGVAHDGERWSEVDIGEILVYPQDKNGVQSDVENYLSDKWGVSLS